jgi:hypothetical protein
MLSPCAVSCFAPGLRRAFVPQQAQRNDDRQSMAANGHRRSLGAAGGVRRMAEARSPAGRGPPWQRLPAWHSRDRTICLNETVAGFDQGIWGIFMNARPCDPFRSLGC